ncbi:GGDEF domain-containing protein [Pseudomonas sp. W3I7]|jgi:GGDEF domain-containing protein|nr:GGDEF domain-containing protein [Pseudomonas sp. W3I7]
MINASLRTHLTLWFAGLSLLTLLSVGIYVGHIATEQMKQASADRDSSALLKRADRQLYQARGAGRHRVA